MNLKLFGAFVFLKVFLCVPSVPSASAPLFWWGLSSFCLSFDLLPPSLWRLVSHVSFCIFSFPFFFSHLPKCMTSPAGYRPSLSSVNLSGSCCNSLVFLITYVLSLSSEFGFFVPYLVFWFSFLNYSTDFLPHISSTTCLEGFCSSKLWQFSAESSPITDKQLRKRTEKKQVHHMHILSI